MNASLKASYASLVEHAIDRRAVGDVALHERDVAGACEPQAPVVAPEVEADHLDALFDERRAGHHRDEPTLQDHLHGSTQRSQRSLLIRLLHGALVEHSGRNRWQPNKERQPANGQRVAVSPASGCHRLSTRTHGKEGVDGSSPSEGFCKAAHSAAFRDRRSTWSKIDLAVDSVSWREAHLKGLWTFAFACLQSAR